MSNLQIIEGMCGIVMLQNKIIMAQADFLSQLDSSIMLEEIAEATERANRLCRDDG